MVGLPSFGVLSNVTRKTFDLYIKGRLQLAGVQTHGRAEPLIVCLIGWFAKQTLDCIHPACFCLSAENVSPSRGARGLGAVVGRGFGQGLKQWLSRVVQQFSFFWQTMEHTLFIFIHLLLKSNFVIL